MKKVLTFAVALVCFIFAQWAFSGRPFTVDKILSAHPKLVAKLPVDPGILEVWAVHAKNARAGILFRDPPLTGYAIVWRRMDGIAPGAMAYFGDDFREPNFAVRANGPRTYQLLFWGKAVAQVSDNSVVLIKDLDRYQQVNPMNQAESAGANQ